MSLRNLLPDPATSSVSMPPLGHIDGLILSNDTDADHDISVSAGEATLEDASGNRVLGTNASAFVKQIDASWAAGTAAGGLASALTLSNDTWYHLFAISGSGGALDFGFDSSVSATNLLADATSSTYFRRIGSVLTDGSANILGFFQRGDWFAWNDPPQDIAIVSVGDTNEHDIAISVPLGVNCRCQMNLVGGSVGAWYVHDPAADDEVPAAGPNTIGTLGTTTLLIGTDTSSQVSYRSSVSGGGANLTGKTIGWFDPRGRSII